jgi:transposase
VGGSTVPAGRPTKLTPEKQEEILRAIRNGNYIETAAACAGISKPAFYDWLKRGALEKDRVEKDPRYRIRKEEQKFVEFSNAVQKALAGAEDEDLSLIRRASRLGAWQASAWRLERKFPNKWGHKARVEVTGKDGESIKHEDVTPKSEAQEIREIDEHIEKLEQEQREIDAERARLEAEIAGSGA